MPSIMTSSLSAKRPLKPRIETAHLLASMRATSTPGTIRRTSGMLVAPERRMSSAPMTKAAAAVSASGRVCRLTELTSTTSTFISSSRLSSEKLSPAGPALAG